MARSLPACGWQCQRSPCGLLADLAVGGGQGGQTKGISRTISPHGPHQWEELGIWFLEKATLEQKGKVREGPLALISGWASGPRGQEVKHLVQQHTRCGGQSDYLSVRQRKTHQKTTQQPKPNYNHIKGSKRGSNSGDWGDCTTESHRSPNTEDHTKKTMNQSR